MHLPKKFTGNLKADNTLDGKALNCEVKGKTLNNIFEHTRHKLQSPTTFTSGSNSYGKLLKPSTLYTVIFFNNPNKKIKRVYMIQAVKAMGTLNNDIALFTTKPDVTQGGYIHFYTDEDSTVEEFNETRIMVLEGDHTSNPPAYFEGIASTGSAENNTLKMISSNGLQILKDGSLKYEYTTNSNGSLTGGNILLSGSNGSFDIINDFNLSTKENIHFKITSVTTNANGHVLKVIHNNKTVQFQSNQIKADIEKNGFSLITATGFSGTSNLTIQGYYAGFTISEIVVVSTNYEEYKESQVACKLPFEGGLKEGDVWKVSEGKIIQNKKLLIAKGVENWGVYKQDDVNVFAFRISKEELGLKPLGDIKCDKLKRISNAWSSDEEGIATSETALVVKVNKDKLTAGTVAEFKKWLSLNNLEIIYELATSIIHEVPAQQLATFKPMTHITQNNAICGQTSCKIPASSSPTTFSDGIWLPTISANGDISWNKSSTTTPPTSRNIKGPKGDTGSKGEKGDTGNNDWSNIINKPSTFAPSEHSHDYATSSHTHSNYADTSHAHSWSQITEKPNLKAMWTGTQAQYDAISSKDANTLYFITE